MQILVTRRKDGTKRFELMGVAPGVTVVMPLERFETFANLVEEAYLRRYDQLPDEFDYLQIEQYFGVDGVTLTRRNFKNPET